MVIPGNTGLGKASNDAVQGQFLTLANCDLLLGNLYSGRFGYTHSKIIILYNTSCLLEYSLVCEDQTQYEFFKRKTIL